MGEMQAPAEAYTSHAFFKGFQEGYLTMDTLASFVFGIIIINAIKEKGAKTKKDIMIVCAKATLIAASILAMIYSALSFMGASSVAKLGHLDNGGAVLAKVSNYYFGSYGGIILGIMVTAACLTTSVGLVSACSSFFHKLFPNVSYKKDSNHLISVQCSCCECRFNAINRNFCSCINRDLSISNRLNFPNAPSSIV